MDIAPTGTCFVIIDQAGVQIGINRHLFAGHRIECETGSDLGDPLCAFGDYDELNQNQDNEHNKTDHRIATNNKAAERQNDFPCVALQQNQPGRRNIQRQPKQCGHE